jgi:hypothetical protein
MNGEPLVKGNLQVFLILVEEEAVKLIKVVPFLLEDELVKNVHTTARK